MSRPVMHRRRFLISSSVMALAGSTSVTAQSPPVTAPRATDGDDRHEPNWDERLTVTVGQKGADIGGQDDRALQAAVDYVKRLGGGTVQILPGVFTLRNAVFLPTGIRLRGSGADSVLTKIGSQRIPLAADSDWYDQEITLREVGDFRVGDGVALQGKDPHSGQELVIKRTLVARSGKRFKLSDGLRENLWSTGSPTCASLFPLITSEYTADVVIENLTLDGNAANNENFNGNYGGCIFLQDCSRYSIRQVTARNYHGDGISFQVCHDILVEDCHCHDNRDLGIHPGSGSQRPVMRSNRLERNAIGLFWCWGVKYGLAEGNRIAGSRKYGISIGHNDTDNVMRNNEVLDSGEVGILFRDEATPHDFWAHRNTIERNRIANSGSEQGIAIDIQGHTRDVQIMRNTIEETRGPGERIGIRVGAHVDGLKLADNSIRGFSMDVLDRRA